MNDVVAATSWDTVVVRSSTATITHPSIDVPTQYYYFHHHEHHRDEQQQQQHQQQQRGHQPLLPFTVHNSTIYISDEAWQEFLQQFRVAIDSPQFHLWLPVVIRGDHILCRREHIYQLARSMGMNSFVQMMLLALGPIQAQIRKQRQQHYQQQHQQHQQHQQQHHQLKKKPESNHDNEKLPIWKHDTIPLLMGLGDHSSCGGSIFPRFSWCTTPEHEPCRTIAIPTFHLFLTRPEKPLVKTSSRPSESTRRRRRQKKEVMQQYSWSSKRRQAVWRGSPTGGAPNGWASLPRAQLVNYSLVYPDLFDGAFVNTNQFQDLYPGEVHKLRQFSRIAERIELVDFQLYRAIVDIDGNAWSSRFGDLLCLNSVVVKVKPGNKNYFYDELRPWVHYIPVQADMSDLIDMVRIAITNDTLAQSIVRNANEWCEKRLTRESMALDLFWIINHYISILGVDENDVVTRWRQWEMMWTDIIGNRRRSYSKMKTNNNRSGYSYYYDRPPTVMVPLRPSRLLGIRQWSRTWKMAKPLYEFWQTRLA